MKSIFKIFKKIWWFFNELYAPYRKRVAFLAVVGIMSGFLEGIGVSLLIPLFTYLMGGQQASNFFVKGLEVTVSHLGAAFSFQLILLITVGLFIGKAALLYFFGYVRVKTIANYKNVTRNRLCEGLLQANFAFLRKQKIGHLDNLVMNDVETSAVLLGYLISFVLSFASFVAYIIVASALSLPITTFTVLAGVVLVSAFRPLVKKMKIYSRKRKETRKTLSHDLNEIILGIKTIKSYGVEDEVKETASELFAVYEHAEVKRQHLKNFMKIIIEPISLIFIILVFAVSYKFLQFNVVNFIAIVYLIQQMFMHIDRAQNAINIVSETMIFAMSIPNFFKKVGLYTEKNERGRAYSFKKELLLQNISYGYSDKKLVLSNISLVVPRGEIIGIIGPSGAGKTTIVDIILRLVTPSGGKILLDGVDISETSLKEWRRHVVYVTQDVFLRNATIKENIRFYDASISEEDIEAAVRMAHISDVIRGFPEGMLTVVGDRGTHLSGGERQRIALARALTRNPSILILDEATSALDNDSERAIKEALFELQGKVTVIIIAHRLSSVSNAHQLFVLDKGRVIEKGNPHDLLKDVNSYFYKMSQLGNVARYKVKQPA